jgi:hypothetical protein
MLTLMGGDFASKGLHRLGPSQLNAVENEIPGYACVHHPWCMRYFVSNFFRAYKNKMKGGVGDYL